MAFQSDLKTFSFSSPSSVSITEILDNFKRFSKLYSPVVKFKTAEKEIYTIPKMVLSDGRETLPVFTDDRLLDAPYVYKNTVEFLYHIFYSGGSGLFSFNPPFKKEFPGKEILLDLNTVSLITGFLQCEEEKERGPGSALKALNSCQFHKANYLAFKNINSGMDPFVYSEIFSMIGFYEKAVELIKTAANDNSLLAQARIKRMQGDLRGSAEMLNRIKDENLVWGKNMEYAWIHLLTGNVPQAQKIFSQLSGGAFKQEALFGNAIALLSQQNLGKETVAEAVTLLSSAAAMEGKNRLNILIYLGNLFFNMQDFIKAEDCYLKAFYSNPAPHITSLIGMAEIKRGKLKEAMGKANQCAIFDINSAVRILSALPPDYLSNDNSVSPEIMEPEEKAPESRAANPKEKNRETQASPSGGEASMEPADISARTAQRLKDEKNAKPGKAGVDFETNYETFSSIGKKTGGTEPSAGPGFLSRALTLASRLEEEFNKKIYFNYEGLTDIERKLRLTFIQEKLDQMEAIETVKDCSAFLCFFLKERFKARLMEYEDFDPWAWPIVINAGNSEVASFAIARIWQLLWTNKLPDQGWLLKYIQFLSNELAEASTARVAGLEAVKNKTRSHPEKIMDALMEHRKNIILASSLDETRDIELFRGGISKIDKALRENFKPGVPPTTDGWRLLRCYGHIFAEILMKDFKGTWFNVESNDGLWSLELPWRTYIFPVGKVYKAAANGENLLAYYDKLSSEKLSRMI